LKPAGIKNATVLLDDLGRSLAVRVDMGAPVTAGDRIPSRFISNPVTMQPLTALGQTFPVTLVNMGNPHAVTFVEDAAAAPVLTAGPVLEHDSVFPARANIEFVQVKDRSHLMMRVWERGAGETHACGTGACAAAVAAVLNNLAERSVTVHLLDGDLDIVWDTDSNHVHMTGPIAYVYEGIWSENE